MFGPFTMFEADTIFYKDFGAPISFDPTPLQHRSYPADSCSTSIHRERSARGGFTPLGRVIPHWAKDPSIGNRMINARAESVAEKPAFRSAFRSRRCLVASNQVVSTNGRRRKNENRRTTFVPRAAVLSPSPGFGNSGRVQKDHSWRVVP